MWICVYLRLSSAPRNPGEYVLQSIWESWAKNISLNYVEPASTNNTINEFNFEKGYMKKILKKPIYKRFDKVVQLTFFH